MCGAVQYIYLLLFYLALVTVTRAETSETVAQVLKSEYEIMVSTVFTAEDTNRSHLKKEGPPSGVRFFRTGCVHAQETRCGCVGPSVFHLT